MPPIMWGDSAWDDYVDLIGEDRKTINRINRLLKSISRDERPIGKSERLKYADPGVCSARIDEKNRLVYRIEDGTVYVLSCKGHYSD